MQRIKAGDQVIVLTGRDKGRMGNVIRVTENGEHVLVENVNMAKRHTKPNPTKGESGGIVEKEMPIHISNVAHYNPVTKKAGRVGFKTLEDGKKVRFFRSNGEVVDV